MHQLIDWKLFNNNELLIDLNNVLCEYLKDDYLLFREDKASNKIDFKKSRYERITDEYNMEIDFINNICKFIFPNEEECSFDIDCNLVIDNDKIIIKYKYDIEDKEIRIIIKEED